MSEKARFVLAYQDDHYAMDTSTSELLSAISRVLRETPDLPPEGSDETQRLLELLCGAFLTSDAQDRAAIRKAAGEWADEHPWLLNGCAYRLAERVTGPDALAVLRLALGAVSIENCSYDYRDTSLVVTKLFQLAEQAGLDPRPLFNEVAALSTEERTRGGCDSVAAILRNAGP